ncbi:MAG TPA: hypothetical protein VGA69_01025 [Nitriliruptorales bacterium]
MQGLDVVLDLDAHPWSDLGDAPAEGHVEGVGVWPAGTQGGLPSVVVRMRAPDGRLVEGLVTLRLLVSAVDAMVAAHGDPRFPADGRVEAAPTPGEVVAGYLAVERMRVAGGAQPGSSILEALPGEVSVLDLSDVAYQRAGDYHAAADGQPPAVRGHLVAGAWLEGFYIGQAWREYLEKAIRRRSGGDVDG